MVRRGSTVRVRQRALQSPCKSLPFLRGSTCRVANVRQVWSRLWSLQVQDGVVKVAKLTLFASVARRPARLWACSTAGRRRDEERERALQLRAAAGGARPEGEPGHRLPTAATRGRARGLASGRYRAS